MRVWLRQQTRALGSETLPRAARLYLLHAVLLTGGLALFGVFFNLSIVAFGLPRTFLGTLNSVGIGAAAILSVPLWWLVTRIGLWRSLILNVGLQISSVIMMALFPQAALLLVAVTLTGAAATIFQVSSPPFMMEHSTDRSRDLLFSANASVNLGGAGLITFFAGDIKALLAAWLGVASDSGVAYRATFAVAAVLLALSMVPLLLMRRSQGARTVAPSVAQMQAAPRIVATDAPGPVLPDRWWLRIAGMAWLLRRVPAEARMLLAEPGRVLPLLVSPALISFGAAALIQYLNLFFRDQFAISDTAIGRILAVLGIVTGVAALAAPALSRRLGKPRTIVLTQLLSIPFLLLLGFAPVLAIAVGAAIMRGALFNMGSPLYDAFAMEHTAPDVRPIVIGLINGAYTIGWLISPPISTFVQERYGWPPLFVATTVFYAAAAAYNYAVFVRGSSSSVRGWSQTN